MALVPQPYRRIFKNRKAKTQYFSALLRISGVVKGLGLGACVSVALSLSACASSSTKTAIKADPQEAGREQGDRQGNNNVKCKPTFTQVYQPPLKLGGAGQVIMVPSGEECLAKDINFEFSNGSRGEIASHKIVIDRYKLRDECFSMAETDKDYTSKTVADSLFNSYITLCRKFIETSTGRSLSHKDFEFIVSVTSDNLQSLDNKACFRATSKGERLTLDSRCQDEILSSLNVLELYIAFLDQCHRYGNCLQTADKGRVSAVKYKINEVLSEIDNIDARWPFPYICIHCESWERDLDKEIHESVSETIKSKPKLLLLQLSYL